MEIEPRSSNASSESLEGAAAGANKPTTDEAPHRGAVAPSRRPRVLHVIDSLGAGGAQELLFQCLRATRADVTHYVLALHPHGDLYADRLREIGASVSFATPHRSALRAFLALHRLLRRGDVDLVHAHVDASTIMCCLLRHRASRVPMVVSLYAMREQLPRWRFPSYRFLLRRATRVFTGGPEVAAQLAAIGIVPPRVLQLELHLVPPVSMPRHAAAAQARRSELRTAFGLEADDVVLLRVARLHRDKGVDGLLRVVCGLRRRGVRAKALIVGDGAERAALEALAHELELGEHAKFLGFRQDMEAIHAASDFVVITPRQEAFGQATIDALTYGVPVVAYSMAVFPRLLTDRRTAFLVPEGDLDAVIERLLECVRDPALPRAVAERAASYAAMEFSPERARQSILTGWRSAITAHREKE